MAFHAYSEKEDDYEAFFAHEDEEVSRLTATEQRFLREQVEEYLKSIETDPGRISDCPMQQPGLEEIELDVLTFNDRAKHVYEKVVLLCSFDIVIYPAIC